MTSKDYFPRTKIVIKKYILEVNLDEVDDFFFKYKWGSGKAFPFNVCIDEKNGTLRITKDEGKKNEIVFNFKEMNDDKSDIPKYRVYVLTPAGEWKPIGSYILEEYGVFGAPVKFLERKNVIKVKPSIMKELEHLKKLYHDVLNFWYPRPDIEYPIIYP
jgi:hypothetical protein